MASNYWTNGSGDSSWATAGNWTDGVPNAADDVFIEEGSANISAGLNQSAVTINSLRISFGGTIGTASAALQINVTTTCTWSGTGAFVKLGGTIAKIKTSPTGGGTFYLASGTTTTLEVGRGLVDIDAGAVVTTLHLCSGGVNAAAGTVFTTANVLTGTLNTYRGATTCNIGPGSLVVSNGSACAIGTLLVHPNGRLNHKSSSTITTSTVETGGIANAWGSPYSTLTVTNSTNYFGYGMNFDKNESSLVTFTNASAVIGGEA